MNLDNSKIQIIIDIYQTLFSNQIYPDYFTQSESNTILVNNFQGESTSNSAQIELRGNFKKSFDIKIGYNYLDIFRIEHGHKHRLPFHSKHHILNTISYQPINKNWKIDCNNHWNGKKRLIGENENGRELMSRPYIINNIQFTQRIKNWDLYIGCENISNFRQENPIIGWEDPFGENFDISNIWGPTKGREFYIGLRLTL